MPLAAPVMKATLPATSFMLISSYWVGGIDTTRRAWGAADGDRRKLTIIQL
jgi:hypothetical protein